MRRHQATTGTLLGNGDRTLRVTFLTIMPTPYSQDLFEAMVRDGRIQPRVYYMEMAAPDTYWDAPSLPQYSRVLPGSWFRIGPSRLHVNFGIRDALRADDPDLVVVNCYAGLTSQFAMFWAHLHRRPWIFWGEMPGMRTHGKLGTAFQRLAQRPVARWADGIAAIGSRATEAYTQISQLRCPVRNVPYCCDIKPFLEISRCPPRPRRSVHFLYCGQLIARKGVDVLLRAFSQLDHEHGDASLTLVGEGPMRTDLLNAVPDPLRARVNLPGFQQPAELQRWFAEADVFVLPSRHDGWGVVVNQAIAAGMPVITTDRVGSAHDLVKQGRNGLIIPAADERALTEAMRMFCNEPALVPEYGRLSRERASQVSPEACVQEWYRLCREVLDGRDRPNVSVSTRRKARVAQRHFA